MVAFHKRRNLWFHKGDIGSLNKEGLFYFSCRMAERNHFRGEMVSGFEVEKVRCPIRETRMLPRSGCLPPLIRRIFACLSRGSPERD